MIPKSRLLPTLDWAQIDHMIKQRRVVIDSRKITPGDVFLAFQGDSTDGRAYIEHAIAAGAAAILWEAEGFTWDSNWQVTNMAIAQLRAQVGIVAAHLCGNPSQAMWTIGVTGTNGKTSVAHWLTQALGALQHRSLLIGTLGHGFLSDLTPASLTTPDAATLQMLLAHYQQAGATHLVMEVSSHALDQGRVHGVEFDVAIFTNLTRDHLDYHGTMQQYGAAKRNLFDWEGLNAAIINVDDAFGAGLRKEIKVNTVLGYGIERGDIRVTRISSTLAGVAIEISTPMGKTMLHSKVIGLFNVYNLLAALGALLASGIDLAQATAVLSNIEPALGRMQQIGGNHHPLVVVDYAHTPDALEKALTTLRGVMPKQGKLYCVFGCGGDRDCGKRPLMAEIATTYADVTVITSDNPRSEKPEHIVDDIVVGVKHNSNYLIEIEREKAIHYAVNVAKKDDVILIAGKGHETYQEIRGVRYHFNDVNIAESALLTRGQR
jgi:UDP-N-acetylmuramoyl-L-alanyl-D-glutamate--2,6-diaminopimelate ligase